MLGAVKQFQEKNSAKNASFKQFGGSKGTAAKETSVFNR